MMLSPWFAARMCRCPKSEQAGLKLGLYIVLLVARSTHKCHTPLLLRLCKRRRDLFERREMLVDVGFGVLNGDGPLFIPPIELSQHAAIDHGEPVVAPEIDVDLGPVAVVANFLRIEHQGTVDACAGDVSLQAGFFDDGAIALGEIFAELADVYVILAGQDFAEGCEARGHGHTVRVVGAAVEDFVLGDQIHYRAARSEGSQRQTTADGLGEADHVGLDAEKVARAAPRQLGAGFYFVKNQQRAVLGANIAQPLQESGLRQAQSDVHEDWLENDGGDLAGILFKPIFDALQIVKAGDDNVLERSLWNTTASRNRSGCIRITVVFGLGLDADERSVMQAVIGTLKLQNLIAARGGARDAARVHGDFRSAGTEAHHIHGIAFANFFRKLPFLLVGHAEGCTFVKLLFDGPYDGGMAMPRHQRSEAQVVIDVFVAVNVVNAAAFALLHKNRVGLVMAIVARNSERDSFQRPLVRCRRFRRALFVGGNFL